MSASRTHDKAHLLPSGVTATAVAAGEFHSLVIGSDGHVYAFGANPEGELGNSTTTGSPTPVRVALPGRSNGHGHSSRDGKQFCRRVGWASVHLGRVGNPAKQRCDPQQIALLPFTSPVVVPLPSGVTATTIVGSDYFGLALGSDHHLYQIDGTNDPDDHLTPRRGGHADSKIRQWQRRFLCGRVRRPSLRMGRGTTAAGNSGTGRDDRVRPRSRPVSLPSGMFHRSASAATTYSAYAIGSDGHLYAWGDNAAGQLGIGNDTGPPDGVWLCVQPESGAGRSMPPGQQPEQLGALGPGLYSGYVITVAAAPPSISGTPPSPVNANTSYRLRLFSQRFAGTDYHGHRRAACLRASPCPHPA